MSATEGTQTRDELTMPQPPLTPGDFEQLDMPPVPSNEPALWRNRDYMLLWSGQTVSAFGSSISGIVFPLLILAITNSPASAGIAGALGALPYLFLSLPVGALIDRWDRKRVMILCDTGRALSLASVPVAVSLGVLTVWQLYLNALIEGTLFVFFNIAETACLSRVVSKARLSAAAAQNEATWGIAGLIGPPLGGFIYQVGGRMFPFILDAASYLASVVSLLFIKTQFQGERRRVERNLGAEIKEGLLWLWRHKLIRFIAFLSGALFMVNGATGLIIIVLAKRMGADATSIGMIAGIGAVGGIIGSLLGGRVQRRFSFGRVVVAMVWVEALLFPLYALAPNVFILGAISAVIWMAGTIYNVVQFSYRISLIPDELQGRVNSVVRLIV